MAYLFIGFMKINTSTSNCRVKKLCSVCQKCTLVNNVRSTFSLLLDDVLFPFLLPSCSIPPAFRVISCEAFVVCLTVLPSPLWIQTLVAFGNAPSVITSCGAQPVPQQKEERRPRWRSQSQWLQYPTIRTAQVQEQEEGACQGRKEGWRSVTSPEPPLSTDLFPCPQTDFCKGSYPSAPQTRNSMIWVQTLVGIFLFYPSQRIKHILELCKLHPNYIHSSLISIGNV